MSDDFQLRRKLTPPREIVDFPINGVAYAPDPSNGKMYHLGDLMPLPGNKLGRIVRRPMEPAAPRITPDHTHPTAGPPMRTVSTTSADVALPDLIRQNPALIRPSYGPRSRQDDVCIQVVNTLWGRLHVRCSYDYDVTRRVIAFSYWVAGQERRYSLTMDGLLNISDYEIVEEVVAAIARTIRESSPVTLGPGTMVIRDTEGNNLTPPVRVTQMSVTQEQPLTPVYVMNHESRYSYEGMIYAPGDRFVDLQGVTREVRVIGE